MKLTIEQTVAAVQNAPGSVYTREDVISLLNRLEMPKATQRLEESVINDLCDAILDEIKSNVRNLDSSSIMDYSSAEFSINRGNEVELDNVDIDHDEIASNVVDGIADVVIDFFETLQAEKDSE